MLRTLSLLFAVLLGALALAGLGCDGDKALGEACTSDGQCADGVCVNLELVEPTCSGSICTATCTSPADCPSGPGAPDCHAFSGNHQNSCLYGEWVRQHCRMPSRTE